MHRLASPAISILVILSAAKDSTHSADTSKLFWIFPGRLHRVTGLLNHLESGWVAFPDVASFIEASLRELALRQRRAPGVLAALLRNGLISRAKRGVAGPNLSHPVLAPP
jgi:hypothetical protein